MSYVYSFYNCFHPYPQAVYPIYTQNATENTLHPLYFANTQSSLFQITSADKFEVLLVSTPSTCQMLASTEPKVKEKCEAKQIKKGSLRNKDQNFGWRNQNKQRNVISSILKGYTHCVLQERGMVKLIEELSKKRQVDNGVSNFYEFMSMKFPTRKSYVGLRYMQDILTERPLESPMTYILSITLRHYLKQIYPLQTIQSCRMKKKCRLALLKKARTIISLLFTE